MAAQVVVTNLGNQILDLASELDDEKWDLFQGRKMIGTFSSTDHLRLDFEGFTSPNSRRGKCYNVQLQANRGSKHFKNLTRAAGNNPGKSSRALKNSTPTFMTLLVDENANIPAHKVKDIVVALCPSVSAAGKQVRPVMAYVAEDHTVTILDLEKEAEYNRADAEELARKKGHKNKKSSKYVCKS